MDVDQPLNHSSLFVNSPTQAVFLASNQLDDVARKMAAASDTDPHSCLVAILFSAAWFKASLNEALQDLFRGDMRSDDHHVRTVRLAVRAAGLEERFATVERKLRVLCAAVTKQDLVKVDKPWSGVFLLFQLRNWMMHLRPELMKVREGEVHERSSLVSTQVHPLVDALLREGAITQIPQGSMVPVAHAVQLPGVGRWAYDVAYEGLRTIDAWLPERYRQLVGPP